MAQTFRLLRFAALLVGIGGLLPSLAVAAESEGANTSQLQEIIVTAQKREQSLNDVGLTVNALSGDFMAARQVNTLADLAQAVPSLTFAQSPWGPPVLTLRGVGFSAAALSASPAVTAYVDQAPLSFPMLSSHVNLDLERVEVLNGPQGTLFGQNSTGGAINFIAAKPTDHFAAGASITYGRFNSFNQEAFVSGPLSDSLSARFAERTETADGWQRSNSRPGDSNGSVNNHIGRLILDFHPSDGVKVQLNLNGWKDESQPLAAQFIGINIQHPGNSPTLIDPTGKPPCQGVSPCPPFSPLNPQAADWTAGLPRRDNSFYQATLIGDFKLPGELTLSSISGYTKFRRDEAEDYDGLPDQIQDYAYNRGQITTFSQELRLANDTKNPFRWVVGANYERDTVDQFYNFHYNDSSTGVAFGLGQNLFSAEQVNRTTAGFGNVEFDVAPTVTLTGGARYTDAKISTVNCGSDNTPPYNIGGLFYGFFAGGKSGPYVPGDCFPINDVKDSNKVGITYSGIAPGQPGLFVDSFDQHNVSWRGGIDWKPDPGTLLYFNISKGFKAGVFPTTGASGFSQYLAVKQESLLAFEPGFKLTLLDKTLQLNGALYYYDYKDKQIQSRVNDLFFGQLDVVQNIPKSSVRGAELELVYRPITELTLSGSLSYIDAKIDRFTGISAASNVASVITDFGGTQMPYTAKYQFNLNGDYVVPVNGSMNTFVGSTVSYRSSTNAIIGGDVNPPNATPVGAPLFRIDAYTLVDLRLGLESDKWRVALWGKNIFNKYYWNNVNSSFDVIVRYAGMPATYGITASYKVK